MKMVAPPEIGHFEFDNVEYHRGEDGCFEIQHPEHIHHATLHGATIYDPNAPAVDADPVFAPPVDTAVLAERDSLAAERDTLAAQNADLLRQLDEARAAARATDTPVDTSKTSGDTSGTDEGGADKSLPAAPDTEDYGAMLAWLKDVGVAVPGNISKARAKEIVEETIASKNNG